MFLSDIFTQTLSNVADATIELYNTDGSLGAARGAALGAGYYNSFDECFQNLNKIKIINPVIENREEYKQAYINWENKLTASL